MRRLLPAALLFAATFFTAHAATSSLSGNWREPGGSVIHIAPCGSSLCATLVAISPQAPSQFDIHNPDKARRSHKLCGLVIGKDFHSTSATQAEDGSLYDPKTGKTYQGEMTAIQDKLQLRGYIGFKIFGRSQTWTRTSVQPVCSAT